MDRITLPNGITIESAPSVQEDNFEISQEAFDLLNTYSAESILEAFVACESSGLYSVESEDFNKKEFAKKILEKTVSDKNVIKNNLKLIASKGINLSKDYVDLMSNKSAYIVGSYEFNTVNGTRTRDSLINETLFYKKQDSNFPKNAYVICNLGIDSIFLIQEPSGKIYTYQYGNKKLKLEANNIGELINVILSEK